MGRRVSCQKIGRHARGLVDVPKGLRAMSSGIGPNGLDIMPRRLDVAGGQHADGSGNTLRERTMRRKFERSVE